MTATNAVLATNPNRKNWNALLELATREVFEMMLGCKLTAPKGQLAAVTEITAMVGLAGQLCGVMSIRCNVKASTIMASKMLGTEPDKVGREMCDAFGEICNMVAGNFKNKVPGLGDGCMLSVPTVITGNDYSLHPLSNSEGLELTLLFENSPLFITLQIHS